MVFNLWIHTKALPPQSLLWILLKKIHTNQSATMFYSNYSIGHKEYILKHWAIVTRKSRRAIKINKSWQNDIRLPHEFFALSSSSQPPPPPPNHPFYAFYARLHSFRSPPRRRQMHQRVFVWLAKVFRFNISHFVKCRNRRLPGHQWKRVWGDTEAEMHLIFSFCRKWKFDSLLVLHIIAAQTFTQVVWLNWKWK